MARTAATQGRPCAPEREPIKRRDRSGVGTVESTAKRTVQAKRISTSLPCASPRGVKAGQFDERHGYIGRECPAWFEASGEIAGIGKAP